MEIWKDIEGYEGIYQASTYGNVRSVDRICKRVLPGGKTRICNQKGKVLKLMINKGTRKGVLPRYQVRLSKNGKTKGVQIHRIIAFTFLDGDKSLEVNHKDGNPLNNHIDNLELVNKTDNIRHAFEHDLIKTGKKVVKTNLITGEVEEFNSITKCSQNIGISQTGLGKKLKNSSDGIIINGFKITFK